MRGDIDAWLRNSQPDTFTRGPIMAANRRSTVRERGVSRVHGVAGKAPPEVGPPDRYPLVQALSGPGQLVGPLLGASKFTLVSRRVDKSPERGDADIVGSLQSCI